MKKITSIERLRELFSYDPRTGILTRRIAMGKASVGTPVGTKKDYGRLVVSADGKILKVHRIVWAMVYGSWPNEIDHINGDPSDNRICNLREASRSQQMHNTKRPATNKSGYKGVSFCRETQRWQAHIRAKGRSIRLGRFDSPE